MILSSHGGVTLRVVSGETTIVFNPPKKGAGIKPVRFGADIALISMRVPEMEGIEEVGGESVFVIDSAGSYEYRGIAVDGYAVRSRYGAQGKDATVPAVVYVVRLEDATLLYVVGLSEPSLPPELLEEIEAVSICVVPVGVEGMLDPSEAHKLVTQLEPAWVVPVGWQGKAGREEALAQFLKEQGAQDAPRLEKLTLRPKDIKDADGNVVILTA